MVVSNKNLLIPEVYFQGRLLSVSLREEYHSPPLTFTKKPRGVRRLKGLALYWQAHSIALKDTSLMRISWREGIDAKITHGKWSKLPCQNPKGDGKKNM